MQADQTPRSQSLLNEIAAITTMERGKLTEEYRTRLAPNGKDTIRLGPYYKLQAWEQGRNASRRVAVDEVPALKEDLTNFQLFNELTDALAQEIISSTREQRRRAASDGADDADDAQSQAADAKKNSAKKPAAKGTAKPKPSSRKPKRV